MSDTIQNIPVGGEWINVHTATGIDPSNPVLIQNQSAFYSVQIAISSIAPTVDGFIIQPGAIWEADGSQSGVWIKSKNGRSVDVCVQVNA